MRNHVFSSLATLLILALAGPLAFGQQSSSTTFPDVRDQRAQGAMQRPHVGVTLGTINPDNSYSSALEYGVDVGYQPFVPIGVGIEVSNFSTDRAQGSRSQNLNRTTILPKVTYNMGGTIPVIRYGYMGLGAGAIIDSGSPHTGTHLGLAPLVGFDIPLKDAAFADYMSLGLGAKYVFVSGPSPDSVALNGLVKYWF